MIILFEKDDGINFLKDMRKNNFSYRKELIMALLDQNKSDIDAFILNYANGNVQNGSYTIPNSILNWPGNGDISQNQDVLLAPFVDVNGDNIYSPSAGDYPLIKGDQAIFSVFNDSYLPHQGSGGASIGLEIRLMAYAYGTGTLVANNPYLNYTTFSLYSRQSITISS